MVDIALKDRQARMAALDEEIQRFAQRGVDFDGDHIDPRHHDLAHGRLIQAQHGGNHGMLLILDGAVLLTGGDEREDFRLRHGADGCAAAKDGG